MSIKILQNRIFDQNVTLGWWAKEDLELCPHNKKEYVTLVASKLALVHSEVSEALEGVRKNLNDDHLPHRPMVEVELADTIIRILDLCGFMGLDVEGAIKEKIAYNENRADHKKENRLREGGKTI